MPGQLLEFYGLREHPFGVSPNPRYLYLSSQHREALSTLVSGIENEVGFSALIAEAGVGKTALLFELIRQFKDRCTIAIVSNTQCSGLDLLRFILMNLQVPGWESEQDPIRLYHMLTAFASERQHTNPVVVIIDEAQNLEKSALETLRLLSNLEEADRKLLQIILAGQSELREKLRSNSQLFQRITVIARLGRLSPDETEECIAFRLRTAGYKGPPLFSAEAMSRIKQASAGVPREINRICINALESGFAQGKKKIGIEVIEQVLSDLDLSCGFPSEPSARAEEFEMPRVGHQIERHAFEAPHEVRRFETPTDSWVVDPLVDIGLGDEVIQSALSGLIPSGEVQAEKSRPQTELETEPQVTIDAFSAPDAPKFSFAQAGLGPSDAEIMALLSGMDEDVATRTRASKESSNKDSQLPEVEPQQSSAPPEPSLPKAVPDPRVLKIFAPRKPSDVPAKKIDPQIFEEPPEPVAYRIREDPWVTGVPIDPWGTMGFLAPPTSQDKDTSENQTGENEAEPAVPQWRKNITPMAIWLCAVLVALLILYFALPYLPG